MHKTPFAGLTAPDEGDPPLMVDGGTFATRNPDITDHFLRIGAVTHMHDEHPPLPDPLVAASGAVGATGGTIPAGRDLYIGYTLLDKYGGETRISPVVAVSTPPGIPDPSTAITAAYEAGVGNMVVGTYYFGITLVDQVGGETVMGPTAFIERPPGDPLGQINLSGLAAELGPDGADHWRLWRADNGGAFHIIATGTDDTFTDDGINPTDLAAEPPATSETTGASNMVTVTLPDGAAEPGLDPAGLGSGFVLYVSDDGAFGSPSFYTQLPLGSAATPIDITTLDVTTGSPPDVSTAIPGARKITSAEIEGGAGGGLFNYPQDFTADFTKDYDSSESEDVYYLSKNSGADTLTLLGDRTFTSYYPGQAAFGSAWVAPDPYGPNGWDPGVSSSMRMYVADAPGMREGSVTVRFELHPLDADVFNDIFALIGSPGQPHIYAMVQPSIGGTYLEAGFAERSVGDTQESMGESNMVTLADDTPYWLRVTKAGTVVTAELFDVDPATNPLPQLSTSIDLGAAPPRSYMEWAFRQNGLPGFGWDTTDNTAGRSDAARILEVAAHATSGGDGYPGMLPLRAPVMDHGSTLRPRRWLNFEGDLQVSDPYGQPEVGGDVITISYGLQHHFIEPFGYAPGSAGYAPQQNVMPWAGDNTIHPASAGADARLAFLTFPAGLFRNRTDLYVPVIEAGDIVGAIFKLIDIDNFLIAQIDNTTGSARLQIGSMDAGVFTEFNGVAIPDQSGPIWIRFEWLADSWSADQLLGVSLYAMAPELTIAAPVEQVGALLNDPAKTKYANASGMGLRMVSAPGGANGLTVGRFGGGGN
jgi:hypothetical protein